MSRYASRGRPRGAPAKSSLFPQVPEGPGGIFRSWRGPVSKVGRYTEVVSQQRTSLQPKGVDKKKRSTLQCEHLHFVLGKPVLESFLFQKIVTGVRLGVQEFVCEFAP